MKDDDDRSYNDSVTDELEDDPDYGWYECWTPKPFPGKQPEHIAGQMELEDA